MFEVDRGEKNHTSSRYSVLLFLFFLSLQIPILPPSTLLFPGSEPNITRFHIHITSFLIVFHILLWKYYLIWIVAQLGQM